MAPLYLFNHCLPPHMMAACTYAIIAYLPIWWPPVPIQSLPTSPYNGPMYLFNHCLPPHMMAACTLPNHCLHPDMMATMYLSNHCLPPHMLGPCDYPSNAFLLICGPLWLFNHWFAPHILALFLSNHYIPPHILALLHYFPRHVLGPCNYSITAYLPSLALVTTQSLLASNLWLL